MGVALFWVLPEMAAFLRWPAALAWIVAGFALLWVIDRHVYPVCPACSLSKDQDPRVASLPGFATPLLAAAALHSALDGWSLAAAQWSSSFGTGFVMSLAIHKIPEGVALGAIARASLDSPGAAIAWCALAQAATLVGAGFESMLAPYLDARKLHALLALAGGSFLYLGGHAVHGELRRSGRATAFVPALTGVAGSSVLRLFLR